MKFIVCFWKVFEYQGTVYNSLHVYSIFTVCFLYGKSHNTRKYKIWCMHLKLIAISIQNRGVPDPSPPSRITYSAKH